MYLSNFRKFFRLLVCAPANPQTKMAANDGRPKLTICDVQTIFQCEHWKGSQKIFYAGGLKVTWVVPKKHIIIFLGS